MDERRAEDGHPDTETLNLLAEAGPQEVPGAVRRHVRGCPECRREVEGIRRVLRAAGELPDGIPPRRDLWPGVEARVREGDGRRGAGGASGGFDLRTAGPWLAAAAAVLVAVTAGATLWLTGWDGNDGSPRFADSEAAPAGVPASGAVPASLQGVRSAYVPMVNRLTELVDRRRDRLPPETRRILERNLMIIDAAIAEAEAALAESPTSPTLVRALDRTYERKLDLLQRSARLAAQL